jgi:ribose transport system permease protein
VSRRTQLEAVDPAVSELDEVAAPELVTSDRRTAPGSGNGEMLGDLTSRFALVGVLVVLWIAFSVKTPDVFATTSNLQTILSVQATTGLLALAVVVPLVAGQFDLSTGFQLGLAQSLCAILVIREQWNPLLALAVVLVVGIVIGVINGQLITRLGLPSFTTTLGVGMVTLGLTEWITSNQVITGPAAAWFFDLGRLRILGIPLPFIYLAVVAVLLFVVLELTVWGRRSYAGSACRGSLPTGRSGRAS